MKKHNIKGITLIALVVTIVVLLILAAVSISMLVGENGIIKQTQEAKDESEQARVEELVDLAIGSLIIQYDGDTNKITPKMVADEINRTENRTDVYAEGDTFPTDIIFPEEGRQAEAYLSSGTYDGIYTADGLEDKIASTEIFDYEIIDNAEIGATEWDDLPTKQVKITRIKPKYCNGYGYNPDTYDNDLTDTNYEIVLDDGSKITDTLVIPYKVDGKYIQGGVEGELYTITEVDLSVKGDIDGASLPKVETIIYPNTVKKIQGSKMNTNNVLKRVILSQNLEEIGNNSFSGCTQLIDISIPSNVTRIGSAAFSGCSSLTNIVIPNGVTQIEESTFNGCGNLKEIIIPENIISIGSYAFIASGLENITIPSSVTNIGYSAFEYCNFNNIEIPSSVKNISGRMFQHCRNLENVYIQDGVESIGAQSFRGCTNLKSITIPSSVKTIGYSAFESCDNLSEINNGNGIEYIDTPSIGTTIEDTKWYRDAQGEIYLGKVYLKCKNTSQRTVSIKEDTTQIYNNAFYGCSRLSNITIPEGVTSIERNAFNGCTSLTNITIPSTVTEIESRAFEDCTSLTTVNYRGTKEQWELISVNDNNNTALTEAIVNYNYTGE